MIITNRIILEDDTTLTDASRELNDFKSQTAVIPNVAAEDAIYIGSNLPFNHRYFDIDVANTTASTINVAMWNGREWAAAAEVIDQTESGGVPLAQSGIISWTLDRQKNWVKVDTTERIDDLSSLKIFDLYWARITFSSDIDVTTSLKSVFHRFSTDSDLECFYPELLTTTALTAFKSGKTDWDDQHYMAANQILRTLKARRHIYTPNQILNWELFVDASIHWVAYIAFSAFGDDWVDNRKRALDDYNRAIEVGPVQADQNKNARLDLAESFPTVKVLRI